MKIVVPLAALTMLGVLACAQSPTAQSSVGSVRHRFTCCSARDIARSWHPGEAMTIHWGVADAGNSPTPPAAVTLRVTLRGPYADVDALKLGSSPARMMAANPITVADNTAQAPISIIELPGDLPSGYYNMVETMGIGSGLQTGASVMRIAAPP